MARRTKPTTAPEPMPDPPAWWTDHQRWFSISSPMIRQVGPLHLPPTQRGIAWTPERQLSFVRAVWAGAPMMPLWVVRGTMGRQWLIDGQQRATALGLEIIDADGVTRPPPPLRWSPETGDWSLTKGEPTTLLELATRPIRPSEDDWYVRALAADMARVPVPIMSIDARGDLRVTLRALTEAGVPWTPADLDRLSLEWTP